MVMKVILVCLLVLGAHVCRSQVTAAPPIYLLVTRVFTTYPAGLTATTGTGVSHPVENYWRYEYNDFDSLQNVLNWLNGDGLSRSSQEEMVALYDLVNMKAIPLKQKVIHHQKERKIEVDEWDEKIWQLEK
jgi:hypothetical protein